MYYICISNILYTLRASFCARRHSGYNRIQSVVIGWDAGVLPGVRAIICVLNRSNHNRTGFYPQMAADDVNSYITRADTGLIVLYAVY